MGENTHLSAADVAALAIVAKEDQLLRDLITAVARSYKHGLYLYGPGGIGKSYTTLDQLKKLDVPYILFNSRLTGKGLFQALQKRPEAIFVFEDVERLTKDADAQGVLHSALWAPPGHDCVVTWTTATDGEQRFTFRGGLILISNRPLADLPELRALATRIEVHRLEIAEAGIAALMRDLASRGYRQEGKLAVAPEQCLLVTEHLLAECRAAGCRLDLRLQQKSFQTYLQWSSDCTACHWKDLVAASVREAAHHFRHEINTLPMEDKKKQRRNILRAIMAQTDDVGEQQLLYHEQTDSSRADFFRRKAEVKSKEFDEYDAA